VNAEEIRDLAAIYALGGLEGEDRARFEALLQAGAPEATSALRDFQGTLLELAAATTEVPPPGVKQAAEFTEASITTICLRIRAGYTRSIRNSTALPSVPSANPRAMTAIPVAVQRLNSPT